MTEEKFRFEVKHFAEMLLQLREVKDMGQKKRFKKVLRMWLADLLKD